MGNSAIWYQDDHMALETTREGRKEKNALHGKFRIRNKPLRPWWAMVLTAKVTRRIGAARTAPTTGDGPRRNRGRDRIGWSPDAVEAKIQFFSMRENRRKHAHDVAL